MKKDAKPDHPDLCQRCAGAGVIRVEGPEGADQAECSDCKGTGWKPEEKR